MANIVQCEKHGLRFNADSQDGCVICRREASGGAPPPRAPAGTGALDPSTRVASGAPLGPALLVTAVLITGTTGAFFLAHKAVAGVLGVFMAQDQGDLLAPGVPGFPDGGYGEENEDDYGADYQDD